MSQYRIETTTPDGRRITFPVPDGFLDRVREDHARKLAEKIRAEAEAHAFDEYDGWIAAADMIDPDRG